ncbi:MAG: polysaccharide biosynthesis tyrosine autokinase [Bacteroidales bacterium]|nr:polysaccharide biosynthesis tyrosine autokinase [Bacteroidales bacterium]
MQPHPSDSNQTISRKQPDIINLGKILKLILSKWHLFLISLIVAGTCATVYNKYTIPIYLVSSTILIEEGGSRGIPDTESMLQGFGLQAGAQNLDNQIQILSSWSMINKALDELSFKIDYYRKGLFKRVSYYPYHPIDVIPYSNSEIIHNREFSIDMKEGRSFKLSYHKKPMGTVDTVVSFGSKIDFMGASVNVVPDPTLFPDRMPSNKIYFKFLNNETLTDYYRQRLKIDKFSREGSVIRLSLEGTNKIKDLMFLSKLTDVFLASNLEKKNHEANRIIAFIDEQLVDVSDSLMITENALQEFRSRNRIMDVSIQAEQILDQAMELENEKARLQLESNYFEYLTEYLSKESNKEVPISPATMGISDPLLARLMQELSTTQAEYFSSGVGERNPLQSQLELKIRNTKQSIRETLLGIIRANKMAMDENSSQIRRLNVKAAGLPVKERQLLGIERKFNLNNVLYTFLLQQRAEAQIQKASNKPDNELIDPARVQLMPISPNIAMVYLMAILLGLGIPFVTLLVIDTLNTKINTEEDLKSLTNLPVAGHIPHLKLDYQTVVLNESQSQVADAFRTLRARMQYFTLDTKNPVVLVSSSIPNEGKSFTALNLASAYSLTGKSTVLVGFDLRRPKISPDFGLNDEIGVSTYLIGNDPLKDILYKTNYDNLDVIPAGPIPPNPAELIDSERTVQMFNELRKKYSYIVVDSAPIGTVSDSYPLAAIADATILIVRSGKSMKGPLEATLAELDAIGINHLSIIVNDVKATKGAYSSAYKYKYNYSTKKK